VTDIILNHQNVNIRNTGQGSIKGSNLVAVRHTSREWLHP